MPVNLMFPTHIFPVAGVTLGTTAAGVKYPNRPPDPARHDLLVICLAPGSQVAGVFTQNRFCAAPVQVCREHLHKVAEAGTAIRALVVNTGNANAGTGATGLAHARQVCAALAQQLTLPEQAVLPFSTGVILEHLPVERIRAALPAALSVVQPEGWGDAARAIMTTDTQPKAATRQITLGGRTVTLTGIAKGAGMIHPNMATMLAFIATDADLVQVDLQTLVRYAADRSFNCITVDGDTSTNDSFIGMATGRSGLRVAVGSADFLTLQAAFTEVAQTLAQAIVRDGEGATKFIEIQVEGGRDVAECKAVGYAIGRSPLVKTACHASDPNLGRILAAVGYAGITDLDVTQIELYLGDARVVSAGGRDPAYLEADGQQAMQPAEIVLRVCLHRGPACATVWTCDFSAEYVRINADYRS